MATLVLTAVGTAVAGPLGGALGALAGRTLDGAVFGGGRVEGARLTDLAVTTSSYGAVVPRHFGSVRTAGTVIWATELQEAKESSGGSKGKPKVTSYSYSASFAVALGSNPITGIGRIWADGNLLRGSAGDLKVEGKMRIYAGGEDQQPDPLIASDVGDAACPAFRGIAYIVFEDLALGDFGNRIPALTFEVIGSEGAIRLGSILGDLPAEFASDELDGMLGITHSGGTYGDMLHAVKTAWPITCDGSGEVLSIRKGFASGPDQVRKLPPAAVSAGDEFGATTGFASEKAEDSAARQVVLRYYDRDRDYQPGLQRSRARPGNGEITAVELPATLAADAARTLADGAAMRIRAGREIVSYRITELDSQFHPGALVTIPDRAGLWRIEAWEWRHSGVELNLSSVPPPIASGLMPKGTSGALPPAPDLGSGPTVLAAFGLPWDGMGDGNSARLFAAASSPASGWRGAALYADFGDGKLDPIAGTGSRPATMGLSATRLDDGSPHVVDRTSSVVVELASANMVLADADIDSLARGTNKARLGSEIIQFGRAKWLGDTRWQLSQLLRGRGGTEAHTGGHGESEIFVLLDQAVIPLDASLIGPPEIRFVAALGNSDPEPVVAAVHDARMSLRPYSPVHGRALTLANGGLLLGWTRRSRGSFGWLGSVEVPLGEAREAYEIRYVAGGATLMTWRTSEPVLQIGSEWSTLSAPAGQFEIRQVGDHALSEPLVLRPNSQQ